MIVSIIAAMAERDQGIGLHGSLPWHLPADLARFRRLTMGHTLIMGRITYQSLAGSTLEGRRLIVLTRRGISLPEGSEVHTAPSLERALIDASERFQEQEAFIGGGAQIYAEALAKDIVDRMLLTIVHGEVEADTFFPRYEQAGWTVAARERRPADADNRFPMTFLTLVRA